ncbi:MAG: hypothetical protein V4445_09115 [Pseudomonadota bacterium]
MTNDLTLPQNEIIVGEQLYSETISIILASAQQELRVFDQDLSRGGFHSKKNSELLQRFLNTNPNSRLTIILQGTEFLKKECPRLTNLLQVYGHKITIYETNQSVKHAKDCFIVADSQHYIKRIHIDQTRFKYGLSEVATTNTLNTRFNELLEETQDTVTATTLGL